MDIKEALLYMRADSIVRPDICELIGRQMPSIKQQRQIERTVLSESEFFLGFVRPAFWRLSRTMLKMSIPSRSLASVLPKSSSLADPPSSAICLQWLEIS